MQLNFVDVTYVHPDGETLFNNISFSLAKKITALVGNNGSGKTTIFKLLTDDLTQTSGKVYKNGDIYALPQNMDIYSDCTLQEVLGVDKKLFALKKITNGNSTINDFEILNNEWNIENEIKNILSKIELSFNDLERKLKTFSGGEISKIFFSSLLTRKPDVALLDEPTNNLDSSTRKFLFDFIKSYNGKIFLISHDIELLKLVDEIIEIHNGLIKTYGGNYDFYKKEREREKNNLESQFSKNLNHKKHLELELRKKIEQSNKNLNRGKKDAIKSGLPKIAANARKQNAEYTAGSKLKTGDSKITDTNDKISNLKEKLYSDRIVKIDLSSDNILTNKILIKFENYIPKYDYELWSESLDLEIFSQDRILISGNNGTGKTTILKSICGEYINYSGERKVSTNKIASLNQNFLHLDENLTLYDTIRNSSYPEIAEHEIRIRLGRFLFYGDTVFKKVKTLSGGEKVRLSLLNILSNQNPEILILDEPTNNLDLIGIEQLIEAVNSFNGCLILISHDKYFVEKIRINKELQISKIKKHCLNFIDHD